ncbi:MAG: hypothetical protein F6K42_15050 [Leptolyngbya sp. SIO1D8]|nr:hypothetical protein [Leptolyngbya sp. SIO1D8]
MAIWQFDLELIPSSVVVNAPDRINSAITDNGLDTKHWWIVNQPDNSYADMIAGAFPLLDSWSLEILRWGNEDDVLIEAFVTDGQLEGISVRLDARNTNRESIAKIIKLVNELDCYVCLIETREIVIPDIESLLLYLVKSKAAEFACSSMKFIKLLACKNAT